MNSYLVEKAIDSYGNVVLRAAFSIVQNRHDAEDIFCEVFFQLAKSQNCFNDENYLKAWLIRCAVNMAKNLRKSAWMRKKTQLTPSIPHAQPNQDDKQDVLSAMKRLKPIDRAIIFLHYYEGYSLKEIATMLALSESNTRSRVHRARLALKQFLSLEYNEEQVE